MFSTDFKDFLRVDSRDRKNTTSAYGILLPSQSGPKISGFGPCRDRSPVWDGGTSWSHAFTVASSALSSVVYEGGVWLIRFIERSWSDLAHHWCLWRWWKGAILARRGRSTVFLNYHYLAWFIFSFCILVRSSNTLGPINVVLWLISAKDLCRFGRDWAWRGGSLSVASQLCAYQRHTELRTRRWILSTKEPLGCLQVVYAAAP